MHLDPEASRAWRSVVYTDSPKLELWGGEKHFPLPGAIQQLLEMMAAKGSTSRSGGMEGCCVRAELLRLPGCRVSVGMEGFASFCRTRRDFCCCCFPFVRGTIPEPGGDVA